jgi:hypothetical protein
MKVAELYKLRELFWKLNRQQLVVFVKMCDGKPIKGQPDPLLQGVQDHLIAVEQHTTDPELKEDARRMINEIAAARNSPFSALA